MSNDDDILPIAYKYAWDEDSELSLQDFLTKFKPSMVQNDGTKPWIWVRGASPSKQDTGVEKATQEAVGLLQEITEKVENIKNDDSIPIRSSKKTGAKSKKEVREQVQAEATERLKEISIKHGYVSGKWLIFAPADRIDAIWSGIANSLVSGSLRSTAAYLAKVSTSSEAENSSGQRHLICVYIPDVYDKPSVSEVMRVLLRNHGVNLSGVKSDLYTVIGLDSKHASGIPSTVWKNAAIMAEKEMKELKDAYFSELASTSANTVKEGTAAGEKAAVDALASTSEVKSKASKAKPKLKKKDEDPFASDNEEDESPSKGKVPVSTAGRRKAPAKRPINSKDEDDEDEHPKKKRTVK